MRLDEPDLRALLALVSEQEQRLRIVSVDEVCRELACAKSTVLALCESGELPYWLTPGGQRRFQFLDVLRFALSCK